MKAKSFHRRFTPRSSSGLFLALAAAGLTGCGGGNDGGIAKNCAETGSYACKSGETEPLYPLQWALNYTNSIFSKIADAGAFGRGIDLNVEPVHRQGIKGQGIKVLVIDSGVDLAHEDLKANADYSMSWNFVQQSNDPNPLLTSSRAAHGTNVAGMIAAAQNGKGVMGIAPLAQIGGAAIILDKEPWAQSGENSIDAMGGAEWSRKADIINASYGSGTYPETYESRQNANLVGMHMLKSLRNGKGISFIKAAGNAFDSTADASDQEISCGPLAGAYDCTNPANDPTNLEPNAIVTAALNAKGQASSYSSAGSVVWITGLGGEYARLGSYGEVSGVTSGEAASGRTGDGPTIASTDISGCAEGYSRSDAKPSQNNRFMRGLTSLIAGTPDNPNCDYSNMNGTSSATPTISGVVALMLSTNPNLTWRDVRDILRESARVVDFGYERRTRRDAKYELNQPFNALFDLKTNTFTSTSGTGSDITTGAAQIPFELGWTKNAAGNLHSNWYGFGVPDAAKAVELAKLYKKEPSRSKPSKQAMPAFNLINRLDTFEYQKTTLIGTLEAPAGIADQLQVRLSGKNICLGSIGIAVESPSGTKSLLKMPLDHFAFLQIGDFANYGAGSYTFYGENGKGTWKIYAIASNPNLDASTWKIDRTCARLPDPDAVARNVDLIVEARLITQ